MVIVFCSRVPQLGREGLGPHCACNTRLAHSCNHAINKQTSNVLVPETSSKENAFMFQSEQSKDSEYCGRREKC